MYIFCHISEQLRLEKGTVPFWQTYSHSGKSVPWGVGTSCLQATAQKCVLCLGIAQQQKENLASTMHFCGSTSNSYYRLMEEGVKSGHRFVFIEATQHAHLAQLYNPISPFCAVVFAKKARLAVPWLEGTVHSKFLCLVLDLGTSVPFSLAGALRRILSNGECPASSHVAGHPWAQGVKFKLFWLSIPIARALICSNSRSIHSSE